MFMGFKMGLALTQEGLNNVSAWGSVHEGVFGPCPAHPR